MGSLMLLKLAQTFFSNGLDAGHVSLKIPAGDQSGLLSFADLLDVHRILQIKDFSFNFLKMNFF